MIKMEWENDNEKHSRIGSFKVVFPNENQKWLNKQEKLAKRKQGRRI